MRTAVVTGMIASYPVGGVLWDYGQYVLGLEQLGFEVYYLEDTGWQTYDPRLGEYVDNGEYGAQFLASQLPWLSPSLAHRWHFRAMDGTVHGMTTDEFRKVAARAEVFINVSGGTLLRDEYMGCPRKILIDSDPGWNHFRNYPKWDAQPNWYGSHGYRAHDFFFTNAERLGKPDCPLPDMGLRWHTTRPPVVMDCWHPKPPARRWNTIMTWKNFQEPIVHQGVTYGTKEMEFGKVESLPRHLPGIEFEVASGGANPPVARWREFGWNISSAQEVSANAETYRDFIASSRGEFSVAKNIYVATRCGWFSCRTVCYLAAGRPAVVQDTGFSEIIATGEGLFAFTGIEDAGAAIRTVESDYERHSRAARELARRYFDARVVLGDMLEKTGIGS